MTFEHKYYDIEAIGYILFKDLADSVTTIWSQCILYVLKKRYNIILHI